MSVAIIEGMDSPPPNDLFNIVRRFHIASGAVALVIAPLAMITVKGGLWHRRWGKIYFWAMAGVAVTASVMCWLRSGLFLFLVAIFSFYLALTGYTVLRRKRPEDRANALDWSVAVIMLLAGTGFVFTGLLAQAGDGQKIIRIVFGLLGVFLSGLQIRYFVKPSQDKRAWFYAHMTRFLGAYIATVTAFSVVNFKFLPYVWRWLGPTVVGTLGIMIWLNYYKRKFEKKAQVVP